MLVKLYKGGGKFLLLQFLELYLAKCIILSVFNFHLIKIKVIYKIFSKKILG